MTDLVVVLLILGSGLVLLGLIQFCELGAAMTGFEILTGLVTLAVFVYLVYTLVRAEDF